MWVKCEPKLPPHVRFYAKNVRLIRKTRIEFRADIAARADAREVARLQVDDWRDETTEWSREIELEKIEHQMRQATAAADQAERLQQISEDKALLLCFK